MTEIEYKELQVGPKTFEVPKHWEKHRIEDITNIVTRGKQPTYVKESDVQVINQECIYWDGFHQENVKFLDEEIAENWKEKYYVHDEDILINSTGKGTLGRVLYWKEKEGTFVLDSHVTRLDLDKDKAHPEFMRYYLESPKGQEAIFTYCVSGSTGQIELSKGDLLSTPLITPSVAEQRRIAEILSTVDEAIQQTDEIIETSKELKKGLMQDLLTKGIGHDEFKEVRVGPKERKIPSKWEFEELENKTEVITKGKTPTSYGFDYQDEGINFVKIESIDEKGNIDFDDVAHISEEADEKFSSSRLEENDLLFSIAGGLGQVTHVSDEILPANINQALAIIRLKDEAELLPEYLEQYLRSNLIQKYIESISTTTSQANLSLTQVSEFEVAVPPLDEQREIAERLSVVDEKIRQEEEYREKLEELKKGLMQDLLTGEVRVEK